ncbi:hypothetical protein TSUD_282250 [Trifolium subterraneum]|uniref:Uncharacterized protein n=1 Tax=Trifolium subterraneum TaxID=3900 RepID=A0A2Z6LX51_TRISU|nr:hypothetical protein TSUD_282250 [Trifolium subterraneum]
MVLLRELDGEKYHPLVIHSVGSDWERLVRAHYTRADGTLNINGYYSEMFGFPVNSSDFESGDSDTDSDSSGNDSNCVIISPFEFSSKNPNNRSLIVADSVATISTSMEISSRFTTNEFVSTFRQAVQVSGEGGKNQVAIDHVAVGEFVTTVNEQEPHYFYVYTHVLQTLNLWLPFNSFECQILRGTRVDTLNEYERQAVAAFSRFYVMSSGELIARENKPHSLGDYMSSMSTLSAQQRVALVLKARAQRAEAERVAASADAMAQLEGEDTNDQPLKSKRVPRNKSSVSPHSGDGGSSTMAKDKLPFITCCASNPELKKGKKRNLSASLWTKDFDSFFVVNESFHKYARTSSLSDLDFEDLRQAAMNHHIQGAMLSYYLSTRQELDTIEARNKMESADNGLSALEKEYVAAKSKFGKDLAAVKAGQQEAVKAVVKAKDDEVISLKGKVKALEGELVVATQGKEEASQKVDTLTAKVDALEMDVASQYDDGFRFTVNQMKVVFPNVDIVKLGELDSLHQIVDGKLVPFIPPASN